MRTASTIAVLLLAFAPAGSVSADGVMNLFNTGCAITDSPAHGCFSSSLRGPVAAGEPGIPTKQGEACGWNLLALISVGDVRITTAMKNGGITKITSVDKRVFELIPGFYGYSRYCTVVNGE